MADKLILPKSVVKTRKTTQFGQYAVVGGVPSNEGFDVGEWIQKAIDDGDIDVGEALTYNHPNHLGDVSSVGDGVTTININTVSNTKLANMPAFTIKGNDTGISADPMDLSVAEVKILLAYIAANITNTPAGTIAATNVQAALNELDTEKQVDILWQNEGVGIGSPGTIHTVNFTGDAVTAASPLADGVLTVEISGGGDATDPITVTAGTARVTYFVLTGTPIITFPKSAGTATMGVTGGTIKLSEVVDNLNVSDTVSNSIRYDFIGTGVSTLDAYPTVLKYTINTVTPTVANFGDVGNQQDTDNTPPVYFGDIVTAGTGTMSARLNNISSNIYVKFTWTKK